MEVKLSDIGKLAMQLGYPYSMPNKTNREQELWHLKKILFWLKHSWNLSFYFSYPGRILVHYPGVATKEIIYKTEEENSKFKTMIYEALQTVALNTKKILSRWSFDLDDILKKAIALGYNDNNPEKLKAITNWLYSKGAFFDVVEKIEEGVLYYMPIGNYRNRFNCLNFYYSSDYSARLASCMFVMELMEL